VPRQQYGITLEQAAGTSLLWRFDPMGSSEDDE